MLVGNAILCISSLGCCFASSIEWLMVARFFQGIGAAASLVLIPTILSDLYPSAKAATAYSAVQAYFLTILGIAPIMGGLMGYWIGWRGIYIFTFILCFGCWVALFFWLKESHVYTPNLSIKKGGLFRIYVDSLMKNLSSPIFLIICLMYGFEIALFSFTPFLYIILFKQSTIQYIVHIGLMSLLITLASLAYPKLLKYFQLIKILILGVGVIAVSVVFIWISYIILYNNIVYSNNLWLITLSLSLFSIGSNLVTPHFSITLLEIMPKHKGFVSTLSVFFKSLAGAFITWIILTIFHAEFFPFIIAMSCAAILFFLLFRQSMKTSFAQNNKATS
jgi:DHA1 family bicyclomycin/chloramphenicol resistance-like MFS transporter